MLTDVQTPLPWDPLISPYISAAREMENNNFRQGQMGPYSNGAGATTAIIVTIASVARMTIEKSVWMVIFKGLVYAALMPS